MIDIKNYLHYYIGCDYWTSNSQGQINSKTLPHIFEMIDSGKKVQPILRRLSDMTREERTTANIWTLLPDKYPSHPTGFLTPAEFHALISRGFWLFGDEAFEQGIIIDAATLNKESKA